MLAEPGRLQNASGSGKTDEQALMRQFYVRHFLVTASLTRAARTRWFRPPDIDVGRSQFFPDSTIPAEAGWIISGFWLS